MKNSNGIESFPSESPACIFFRFLKFGSLAWGGPVAQIAMIREELVKEEKWVTEQHFNRVLAMYQVLPGPEAHELCVYFGMLAGGRLGGFLAGLGFMLPGFLLMFFFSWLYVRYGFKTNGSFATIFALVQAAVVALIVRAIHRIVGHVLIDRWLWTIAILAMFAQLIEIHFAFSLIAGGIIYVLAQQKQLFMAINTAIICGIGLLCWFFYNDFSWANLQNPITGNTAGAQKSFFELFLSGLKAGLLTFGGAYTVIPFLQEDAVVYGGWMSNTQFLDGLALSGLLPAPLIIFATFVGYLGGGGVGAILLTVGIFMPAFAFTLLAHRPLEKLVNNPGIKEFLEGVTAGVVGLIGGTTITLLKACLINLPTVIIFSFALAALFYFKSKYTIPLVVISAALIGAVFSYL